MSEIKKIAICEDETVAKLLSALNAAQAEITKLKSQLEEARARVKLVENAHEETAAKLHTYIRLRAEQSRDVEEARRKAIEEAAQRAEDFLGLKFGWEESAVMVANDIRALLSAPTEARSASEAHKEGR